MTPSFREIGIMTFEQWQATRKEHDALSEDDAGVYAGAPGITYDAGFILSTGVMGFTVPLPQDERQFATISEAEAFLWREWCDPEINGAT